MICLLSSGTEQEGHSLEQVKALNHVLIVLWADYNFFCYERKIVNVIVLIL